MTDDLLARLDESLGAVRDGLVPAAAGARHRGAAAGATYDAGTGPRRRG